MRSNAALVAMIACLALTGQSWAQNTVEGTPTDLLPPAMRGEAASPPAPKPQKKLPPKEAKPARTQRVSQTEPERAPIPVPLPPSSAEPAPPTIGPTPIPVPPAILPPPPPPRWTRANAEQLLGVIGRIGARGLSPKDYDPEALRVAIDQGEGDALNTIATDLFTRLGTDLRDGRTPKSARVQWLIKDTDAQTLPIRPILEAALTAGQIGEGLASLEPEHVDYTRLLNLLDKTPASSTTRINQIKANLERWRWMPQKLGPKHLFANVPEYRLRVFANNKILANYPVIVGKKNTQTPAIDAMAQGVVIHPPWYLPRSIINESVGALIARSPATAKARGYVWTGSGKTLAVTQLPGPTSALGRIKVDMPNAEAIFIHDTPARHLFGTANQALSHGCLRTDRAMELGILLGILQAGGQAEELAELIKKGKTERVPFKENIPVFITYFTMGSDVDGVFRIYEDLYSRDASVIASLAKPRSELIKPKAPVAPEVPVPDVVAAR